MKLILFNVVYSWFVWFFCGVLSLFLSSVLRIRSESSSVALNTEDRSSPKIYFPHAGVPFIAMTNRAPEALPN